MERKRKLRKQMRIVLLSFIMILMAIPLYFKVVAEIKRYRIYRFVGEWDIVSFKNRNNSSIMYPVGNIISIYSNPRIMGGFPNAFRSLPSLANLVDINIIKRGDVEYVHFQLDDKNEIFKDTFEVVFLNRDSLFIRSNAVELKCVKVYQPPY
jgi:hypothetical protein